MSRPSIIVDPGAIDRVLERDDRPDCERERRQRAERHRALQDEDAAQHGEHEEDRIPRGDEPTPVEPVGEDPPASENSRNGTCPAAATAPSQTASS